MARSRRLSEAETRALYARYQAGATLAELAVDCAPATVMYAFRRLGLTRRRGGNWSGSHKASRDRRVIAAYLNHSLVTDIARENGVSRQRIYQILSRAGYPKNDKVEELLNETLDNDNDT